MSIWRFADRLPAIDSAHRISLGEGDTPLVRSANLGPSAGLNNLYYKLETVNPTGSYKDRFAARAVADMRAAGKAHCVATSSGNTGSALAAYCAAAGLSIEIAVVEGAPPEKLSQMMVYGADVYMIEGFGLDPDLTRRAFAYVKDKAAQPNNQMQISAFAFSPVGMDGVRTIGFELLEQRDDIAHVFVPAGGGGLCTAVARGLEGSPVRVQCVQPEGNDTIATPLREGAAARVVTCTSKISGLQVPDSPDGDTAIEAVRAQRGGGHVVTDEAVWQTQARMAAEDGVFCEPAAAVSVAGAIQAAKRGAVDGDDVVVAIVTGVGFKDAPSVKRMLEGRSCPMRSLDELI